MVVLDECYAIRLVPSFRPSVVAGLTHSKTAYPPAEGTDCHERLGTNDLEQYRNGPLEWNIGGEAACNV